jgi:hypothetical protein
MCDGIPPLIRATAVVPSNGLEFGAIVHFCFYPVFTKYARCSQTERSMEIRF